MCLLHPVWRSRTLGAEAARNCAAFLGKLTGMTHRDQGVASCTSLAVVTGAGGMLMPKTEMTRAEAAGRKSPLLFLTPI
ncbi:hypothetical protein SAMN02799630_05518 [Paenibacillus sp. UNCCL117]|nr:hypothetical protein SAMN04488602_1436 [Paenibacillus sp. cl123]SFW66485.1 hypothetical protein SAMN02799630_05518 [Paenibacillus sp. UNCCL117]